VKRDLNTLSLTKHFFTTKQKWVASEGNKLFAVIQLTDLLASIITLTSQECMSDM